MLRNSPCLITGCWRIRKTLVIRVLQNVLTLGIQAPPAHTFGKGGIEQKGYAVACVAL